MPKHGHCCEPQCKEPDLSFHTFASESEMLLLLLLFYLQDFPKAEYELMSSVGMSRKVFSLSPGTLFCAVIIHGVGLFSV